MQVSLTPSGLQDSLKHVDVAVETTMAWGLDFLVPLDLGLYQLTRCASLGVSILPCNGREVLWKSLNIPELQLRNGESNQ